MEDVEELCNDDVYAGRLSIAACNSLSIVTLSGDSDAIDEMCEVLEDEGKFYRSLRVDSVPFMVHGPMFSSICGGASALACTSAQALDIEPASQMLVVLQCSRRVDGSRKIRWISGPVLGGEHDATCALLAGSQCCSSFHSRQGF